MHWEEALGPGCYSAVVMMSLVLFIASKDSCLQCTRAPDLGTSCDSKRTALSYAVGGYRQVEVYIVTNQLTKT